MQQMQTEDVFCQKSVFMDAVDVVNDFDFLSGGQCHIQLHIAIDRYATPRPLHYVGLE